MFRNNFCIINENVSRRYRRTNSQFLRQVMHEELEKKGIEKQEIISSSENPMIVEQKLQSQICSEVQKLKKEKFLKETRKRLLHQNEDELRELDVQIKRAHLQRELFNQKTLNESKLEDRYRIRLEQNKRNAEEWKLNEKINLEKEMEICRKKGFLRQDLLKQMQEKDEQRKSERNKIKNEQKCRQKLLESIKQDIKMEEQSLFELKQILRKERDEYLQKVAWYKEQTEAKVKEDIRQYDEMIKRRDEQNRLRIEERKKAIEKRAALSQQIGQQVFTIETEKKNRNEFLQELLVEERLTKDNEREKRILEKQILRSRALQKDFQRCFLIRHNEMLSKREEEKNVAKEQQKIFNNLERADIEMKHLKLLQNKKYRQDLLNVIEFKNSEHERRVSQNKADYEHQLALQKKRQEVIDMEKLILLKEMPLEDLRFVQAKSISDNHRLLLGIACKEKK